MATVQGAVKLAANYHATPNIRTGRKEVQYFDMTYVVKRFISNCKTRDTLIKM